MPSGLPSSVRGEGVDVGRKWCVCVLISLMWQGRFREPKKIKPCSKLVPMGRTESIAYVVEVGKYVDYDNYIKAIVRK